MTQELRRLVLGLGHGGMETFTCRLLVLFQLDPLEAAMSAQSEFPANIKDWTKDHVKQWVINELKLGPVYADILYQEDVAGAHLFWFQMQDLAELGIKAGKAIVILRRRDEHQKRLTAQDSDRDRQPSSKVCKSPELPPDIHDWTIQHVRQWMIQELNLHPVYAKILQEEEVSGAQLLLFEKQDLLQIGIKAGPAIMVLCERDEHQKQKANEQKGEATQSRTEPTSVADRSKRTCQPHPFDVQQGPHRYIVNYILVPETGPSNLIDPCHEYKSFRNTSNMTEMKKFTDEVFRFASACMNCRTNGTIHFGVEDTMKGFTHGEILGVEVDDQSKYGDILNHEISNYFQYKLDTDAKKCIRPPRFVEVLKPDLTSSKRYVIEVDVVSSYSACEDHVYYIWNKRMKKKKSQSEKCLFIRDGASSRNIFRKTNDTPTDSKTDELGEFLKKVPQLATDRKTAEENYSKRPTLSNQGLKLINTITGGENMLDNSRYKWYMLVTNKCHPSHRGNFEFLKELSLFAVLDFDSESAVNGVCEAYCKFRIANLHFPDQFKAIQSRTDTKEKLNLYKQTSWIFCNGRQDLDLKLHKPSKNSDWPTEKGAAVRHVISFLCGRDIMPQGKFLVVFLLLSPVDSFLDPVLETFSTFRQELTGLGNMLCICENQIIFQQWKDLIQARYEIDVTGRCIYDISLVEVNGTILSIKTQTCTSRRFLPCLGFSSVELEKKDEDSMASLDILCKNECEGTEVEKGDSFHEFKQSKEEHFYRGGKVCWWNFYFTQLPESLPFIKRDKYSYLYKMITSTAQSSKRVCEIFNLFHQPGCGGTTLAMHVLWELRKEFRCAVLKDKTDQFEEIARQVIQLATCGKMEQSNYTPVLLLVDDLEELENVRVLQFHIQETVAEKNIRFEKPLVLILNCMRSQEPKKSSDMSNSVSTFLTNKLSEKEQEFFEAKLKEIENHHRKPETFYGFMIMKKNFEPKYIEDLVHNTLKGFKIATKQAQLLSFLALLKCYARDSSISMSLCEDFLELDQENHCISKTVQEEMGGYSTLFISTEVQARERYQGICIIHQLVADYCIKETAKYNVSQSVITKQLLAENVFYEGLIGTEKLKQDVQNMLVIRRYKEDGDDTTLFSPLIEAIQNEEQNADVKGVLIDAANRFDKNPFIAQVLARYFYLREKDFPSAHSWAEKAKQQASDNSYIADTVGQVFKSELKSALEAEHAAANKLSLTPENLHSYLTSASSALDAFRNCQVLAKKEHTNRQRMEEKNTRMYGSYNTLGYLGDIEVSLTIVNILEKVPLFQKKHHDGEEELLKYLSGSLKISNIRVCDSQDEEFLSVLTEYDSNLSNLKIKLKEAFQFYEDYFVFFKSKSSEKETAEMRIRRKVSNEFVKYIERFFKSVIDKKAEKKRKPKISLQLEENEAREVLKAYKGDTFSGILSWLLDRKVAAMETIVEKYKFILVNSPETSLKDKENYILANIVLNCLKPESSLIKDYKTLTDYLKEVLCVIGPNHQHLEPFFLASLLLWPNQNSDIDSRNMSAYVKSMRDCFRKKYGHLYRSKQTIVHFYLGKKPGLNRLVQKARIEQSLGKVQDLNALWQSGEIWKQKEVEDLLLHVKGRTEGRTIFLQYGSNHPIEVRPAYLGQLRTGSSNEKVSFFLGLSINGPIAYGIEFEGS
nr:PREDICTED: sterile alpha motif domain-containing protein 9-like [Latimeria chalumnae]|eukprot:XP_014346557.1 PREDICTED: sterile alpha motif domain-containing protein 9-like [Latimeria chalumnae]